MKVWQMNFLFLILTPILSCSQDCYEIKEIKEINYDISNMEDNSQTTQEYIISEKAIDYEQDNLYHIYSEESSLSQNYFGIEITERKSNRRFVKRNTDEFEEKLKHQENPFLENPVSTGKKKMIGSFNCVEYIGVNKYKTNLTFWIAEDFPFIYKYQHPYKFPGFVVSSQVYLGQDTIVETIYDLKKVECTEYFKNMVEEVNINK